jgi:hypothetical protein
VAVSKLAGGEHFDLSEEGAASFASGAVDGALAVITAGISAELQMAFARALQLEGRATSEMTLGVIRASERTLSNLGHDVSVGSMRGLIDGVISGAVGNLVITAADEASYRDGIWQTLINFGRSALLGAGLGGVTGGVIGGGSVIPESLAVKGNVRSLDEFLDGITPIRALSDDIHYSKVEAMLQQINELDNWSKAGIADVFAGSREAEILGTIDNIEMNIINPEILMILRRIKEEAGVEHFRNMAALNVKRVNVPISKTKYVAHSGKDSGLPKFTNASTSPIKDEERIFSTTLAPTEKGTLIPRSQDAEIKMFEELAGQLGARPRDLVSGISFPEITGEISLFSELIPCLSCSPVIVQFNTLFPNIKIRVFSQNKRSM